MTRTLLASLFAIAGLTAADAPPAATPYPFDSCIISGEPLGSMGEAIVEIHEGREVKFCCKGCIKSFKKDPAKHVATLDQAAKDKAAGKHPVNPAAPAADDTKKKDEHKGHGHDGHAH
ncbi:MAG: hypothetical protein H0W72_03065 [Planctomycetes bacterium]|nr:hypothetical protein [Planctomycetota bacterium]